MGRKFEALLEKHIQFIAEQRIYFVGTATDDSRINISPKGMDSLRVLDDKTVVWLNVTGSGNETAAHIKTHPRMTIMFTAFEGAPLIMRLYGQATAIHQNDADWQQYYDLFPNFPGVRQLFKLSIEMVQTSCGMATPFFDYVSEREQLNEWAENQGENGIKSYWQDNNQFSLDGIPTDILERNT